jgi:RNA polymerase sigma-70 factor (ECF subfamily)
MDDERIIELFWQRSEQAVSAVSEKYGAMCHRIALNLLRCCEDAEECVNDTWHGLWETIPPERPRSLVAFIAKIARNQAMKRLTYRTAAKRDVVIVSFEELNACIPDGYRMEEIADSRDLSRLLDLFLDTLDAESRNIFLRRYWFCDSIREIAKGFGISESKVKVRLFRTRRQLKAYLEEAQIYVG